MFAVRLKGYVLEEHDFIIAADLLESPAEVQRRVFLIALGIFPPRASDARGSIKEAFTAWIISGPADERPDGLRHLKWHNRFGRSFNEVAVGLVTIV
jgi:hypothetical protein